MKPFVALSLTLIFCFTSSSPKAQYLFKQDLFQFTTVPSFPSALVPIDIDDDKDIDLIALNYLWPVPETNHLTPVTVIENLGGSQFSQINAPWADNIKFTGPGDWSINDFNSDGLSDIVVAEGGRDVMPNLGGQNRLLIGNADGKLYDESNNSLPLEDTFTHHISSGDINGDNHPDIFNCNIWWGGGRGPSLYVNNGSGRFQKDPSLIPDDVKNLDVQQFSASVLADTDNDGDLDLFLGRMGPASVDYIDSTTDLLLLNDGQGNFTQSTTALPNRAGTNSNTVIDISAADFNNDGKVDLLISTTLDYQTSKLQLLINQGNNRFVDRSNNIPQSWVDKDWIRKTIPADFNKDGNIDFLAVLNGPNGFTTLYINKGNAVFEDISVSAGLNDLEDHWEYHDIGWTVADFTGDGWLDLVSMDFNQRMTLFTNVISEKFPSVTTSPVSNLSNTTVTIGGDVTDDKGFEVKSRGLCWSESPDPTTEDSCIVRGAGTGTFEYNLANLWSNTTYYLKAWAENLAGITYGDQVTFTTEKGLPRVTTSQISKTSESSASSGGQVINDGGFPVISRGICWSDHPLPTISDSFATSGSGIGTFVSNINGLDGKKKYYVRAWATNSDSTGYGNQITFSLRFPWTMFLPAITGQRH